MYFRSFRFMQTCPFSLTRCARFAFFSPFFFNFCFHSFLFARPLWHDAGHGCEIVKREFRLYRCWHYYHLNSVCVHTQDSFILQHAETYVHIMPDKTRHDTRHEGGRETETKTFFFGIFSALKMKFIDKMHEQGNWNIWERQQNAALKTFCHFYIHIVFGVCAMHDVGVCVLMGQKCKNCVDLANLDSTFDYGSVFSLSLFFVCFRWCQFLVLHRRQSIDWLIAWIFHLCLAIRSVLCANCFHR